MRRGILGAAFVSLGLHAWLASMLLLIPAVEPVAASLTPYLIPVTPLGHPDGTQGAEQRGNAPHDAPRAIPGGTRSAQNIDTQNRGERGDGLGDPNAMLLLPSADGIVLFDSVLNNLSAAQTQRIRTARDRASIERRRATPNPRDAVFLASGEGEHQERRRVSPRDAADGARTAPEASRVGGLPSVQLAGADTLERADGTEDPALARTRSGASAPLRGTANESPGVGILRGRGSRRSDAANVAFDRPSIDEGPAATQANLRARPRDNVDAELLARAMHASWVGATTRSGPRDGDGLGGAGGGGAPGSGGGRGEGGRASSYGPGAGDLNALDTSDARYRRWFLDNRRRVYRALRFPERRALEMDQGIAIYDVVVLRSGRLARAPRLVRSSGFADMDRAALAAIERSTPFTPLPEDLAPSRSRVPMRMPIEFSNPMFQ